MRKKEGSILCWFSGKERKESEAEETVLNPRTTRIAINNYIAWRV